MSTARTIGKNAFVTLASTGITSAVTAALAIITARYLGDQGFGLYGYAHSFVALFSVAADLGLSTLAVRDVAQNRARLARYLDSIWTMRFLLGAIVTASACAVALVMPRPPETRMVVIAASVGIPFAALSSSLRWSFQALQVMEYEALCATTASLLRLCTTAGVLLAGYGVLQLVLADLVVSVLTLLLSVGLVKRCFGLWPRWAADITFWKTLLRESFPFALMIVFSTAYLNNAPVMLSSFASDAATGWFNAASRLAGLIRLFPMVLMPAVYPVMSQSLVVSQQRFTMVIEQSLRLLLSLGLPMAVILTVFGEKTVSLFYGNGYGNAVLPMQLLVWSVVFAFVSTVLGYGLISGAQQKANAAITAVGLMSNVLLNWLLIPPFAATGAAVSVLVAEALVAILAVAWLRRERLADIAMVPLLRPLLAALVMGGAMCVLREHVVPSVFAGSLAYLAILVLSGGLRKEDYQLAITVIGGRSRA